MKRNVFRRWRDVRAGRRSTIGNRVCAKSVSGVRIPISPPEYFRPRQRGLFQIEYMRGPESRGPIPCGGVAEWLNAAVSKTVLPVTRVTRVRIPPPPPAEIYESPCPVRPGGGSCCVGLLSPGVLPGCSCCLTALTGRPYLSTKTQVILD